MKLRIEVSLDGDFNDPKNLIIFMQSVMDLMYGKFRKVHRITDILEEGETEHVFAEARGRAVEKHEREEDVKPESAPMILQAKVMKEVLGESGLDLQADDVIAEAFTRTLNRITKEKPEADSEITN